MTRPTLAAIAVLLALLAPAPGAGQLLVGPLVRMMETADGRGSMEITVRNNTDDPHDVRVVLNDWAVDSAGNHVFRASGTLPESCGERLQPDLPMFHLPARAARTVVLRYNAHVPAADDRCRNIVFFRVGSAADDSAGDQLIISTGVKVYVVPPDGG